MVHAQLERLVDVVTRGCTLMVPVRSLGCMHVDVPTFSRHIIAYMDDIATQEPQNDSMVTSIRVFWVQVTHLIDERHKQCVRHEPRDIL